MGNAIPRLLVIGVMTLMVACEEPESPGEGVTVTDSLGIPVVLSAQPAWDSGSAWNLSDDPELSIGAVEGDDPYLFFRISGAFSLPDGLIVVGHRTRPPGLRIYDQTGKHLRTIGREGEGPGEFRNLQNAWLDDDGTVLAYDPDLGRIYQFTIQGELLESRRVREVQTYATMGTTDWPPRWIDRFSEGGLLGQPGNPVPYESGRSRPIIAFTYLDLGSMEYDTLTLAQGVEWFVDDVEQGYFANKAAAVFSPMSVAVAHDTTAFVSDTKDFWIEEIAIGGRVVRRFGRAWEPEQVTTEIIEEYWDRRKSNAQTDFQRRNLEASAPYTVFAETIPAHDPSMKVDLEGNLWVRLRSEESAEDWIWSVFNGTGIWLGDVSTPKRLRITEIGSDAVVGVWRDDLDVLSVRVYDLIKPIG